MLYSGVIKKQVMKKLVVFLSLCILTTVIVTGNDDRKDKRKALESFAQEMGISLSEVAFVGNDINDLACLTAVRLPIVVQDAHPDVVPLAAYRTQNQGGHGAVREVCDLFEQVLTK